MRGLLPASENSIRVNNNNNNNNSGVEIWGPPDIRDNPSLREFLVLRTKNM